MGLLPKEELRAICRAVDIPGALFAARDKAKAAGDFLRMLEQ